MQPTGDDIPDLHCQVVDGVLTMAFGRGFDSAMLRADWARIHLTRHPGPFRAVRVDLTAQPRLTSNFYAGLMMLHFTYTEQGSEALEVVQADNRTRTNLRVLQLDQHFRFVD